MAFQSTVSDSISFTALEKPPWRKPDEKRSCHQMIREIIDYQNKWASLRATVNTNVIKEIKEKFQLEYCITNTDHPRNGEKQETKNLMAMLRYVETLITEGKQELRGSGNQLENIQDAECNGLLEKSMLEQANRIAFEGVATKKGRTAPGVFSNEKRKTMWKGREKYWYQQPEDMSDAVDVLLDRFNSLITDSKSKSDDEARIGGIFKSVAWLAFELLDLHPFADGNGRVCRVLCSYILSSLTPFTPFPSPIYFPCNENVGEDHSHCPKPCRDDYEQALVDARKSESRHPCKLLTIIVECNWKMWQEFLKEIESKCN